MPTIDDFTDMISVGTVPIHPGVQDYADAHGKIIIFVRDQEEGRSAFLGIELYGEVARLYEVRYDDWSDVIMRMAGEVVNHNAEDPYTQLLGGN